MSDKPLASHWIAYAVIAVPMGVMMNAKVLGVLWAWFLMPIVGIAPPPLATLCGLFLLVRFVVLPRDPDKRTMTVDRMKENVWMMVLSPLAVLLAGWIISLFVVSA